MIFKIHYGLWYGGLVGIIPFTFNYAVKYCGATGVQHGILFTILPFMALIAKPIVCSYADKYAAHRQCLLTFIFLTMLGYGSLAIYPFFPDFVSKNQAYIWILYCLAVFIGNTSMCVVNSLGDSLAINSCSRKNINYGQYRLWGPVGFGIFGAVWGLSNSTSFLPYYTPGILTMILILAINSILLTYWRDDEEFRILSAINSESASNLNSSNGSEQAQQQQQQTTTIGSEQVTTTTIHLDRDEQIDLSDEQEKEVVVDSSKRLQRIRLLWKLACEQKSIFVYIIIFTFCGLLTGIHWQFFFEFLQTQAEKSGQDFSILTAAVLPVQALGGELIFFMLSGKILNPLGAPMTLVICLFSFAARYLLYAYLIPNVNTYYILPVELLQGPAFGLMYSVLTYQANVYSEQIDNMIENDVTILHDVKLKRSLHATMQGILGASFEGLGLGLGSLVGGLAYDTTAVLMWQIAGYSALIFSTFYLIGSFVINRRKRSQLSISQEIDT